MSFFVSSQAEYRASRIAQLLTPTARLVAAMPDGRCIANYDGHMHMVRLDREGKLELVDSVNTIRQKQTPVIEIDG